MRKTVFAAFGVCLLALGVPLTGRAALQPPPVPHPFPQTGGKSGGRSSGPSASSSAPASQPPATAAANPLAARLGLPIYPSAQLLGSYDAGRGQRYYLFGSTASFSDLVAYYRAVLKKRGTMVFDTPATYMFEVGKFDDNTMAFPPGVTIKDFRSSRLQGYPNPKPGGQPASFPSVIQIVPVPQQQR